MSTERLKLMPKRHTLSQPARNTIQVLAQGIVGQQSGYILLGSPFRPLMQQYPTRVVMQYLAIMVESYSNNQSTVRQAGRQLLYGYTSTLGSIVLCNLTDAPATEEVSDPQLVLQAWFLTDNGLLPAAFDHMPEEASPYLAQANNM
jgi:hypothetical protein